MDGTKAITLKEKRWRNACLTEERLRAPRSWISMVPQPTPSSKSGLLKDVLGAYLVAAQTGYQDMDKRLRDGTYVSVASCCGWWDPLTSSPTILTSKSDCCLSYEEVKRISTPESLCLLCLSSVGIRWDLCMTSFFGIWFYSKNILPHSPDPFPETESTFVLGGRWGRSEGWLLRGTGSIGRGEQNFVGPSRVECDLGDLSLTLTSTLFHVQTGGLGENHPWWLRSSLSNTGRRALLSLEHSILIYLPPHVKRINYF